MQLTGKQIIEEGIITGYCEEGVQQQGVDVRIDKIYRLYGEGKIPARGKTVLPESHEIEGFRLGEPMRLEPGYYEIRMMEGCVVPDNVAFYLRHRSSLVRTGVEIVCGQFDAGFCTNCIGCFMRVNREVYIERGARVAQVIASRTEPVTNLYNGQYQNDKQRAI